MELFPVVLLLAIVFVVGYIIRGDDREKFEKIVNEEDGPPPAFELPSIDELRRNPEAIERLRGKVISVGYNAAADRVNEGRYTYVYEESFLVDRNGAVHTIERRAVGANTADVEENARWLARTLDVEFVS